MYKDIKNSIKNFGLTDGSLVQLQRIMPAFIFSIFTKRNFGERMTRLLTNTSCHCQCAQGPFVSNQYSSISGTALGWRCMESMVSCK